MDDKLVTIAQFGDDIDAQMARAVLESNGINAVIAGENITTLYSQALFGLELQVFAADAEKAKQILDLQQNNTQDNPEEDS